MEQGTGDGVAGGGLGGHRFSRDFARYLAHVKPRLVVVRNMQVRYWWASPYGRERVKRGFVGRYGIERGTARYLVALCRASGYPPERHAPTQALMARHSGYWCWEQEQIAQRFANPRVA